MNVPMNLQVPNRQDQLSNYELFKEDPVELSMLAYNVCNYELFKEDPVELSIIAYNVQVQSTSI
jgi:hypothetical protein